MVDIIIIILMLFAFYGAFIVFNNALVTCGKAAYYRQKLRNQVRIMRLIGEKRIADKLEKEIAAMDKVKYFWQFKS